MSQDRRRVGSRGKQNSIYVVGTSRTSRKRISSRGTRRQKSLAPIIRLLIERNGNFQQEQNARAKTLFIIRLNVNVKYLQTDTCMCARLQRMRERNRAGQGVMRIYIMRIHVIRMCRIIIYLRLSKESLCDNRRLSRPLLFISESGHLIEAHTRAMEIRLEN